jgi:hypothetical protein
MVRDRNDGHAFLFQAFIDFSWFVVGLPAKEIQTGSGKHPRCDGVDMEVAAHGTIVGIQYEQAVKRLRNLGKCAHGTH